MHWGDKNGEGSEHLIDGRAAELEIHFVHTKQGASSTDSSYYAVISVLAEVDYVDECGPWQKLDPSEVTSSGNAYTLYKVYFDSLLPDNLDYYYYEGSLTTPPCTETVLWFVLKNKIQVPASYLGSLRQVRDSHGQNIRRNFRDTQYMGGRSVTTPLCSKANAEAVEK